MPDTFSTLTPRQQRITRDILLEPLTSGPGLDCIARTLEVVFVFRSHSKIHATLEHILERALASLEPLTTYSCSHPKEAPDA